MNLKLLKKQQFHWGLKVHHTSELAAKAKGLQQENSNGDTKLYYSLKQLMQEREGYHFEIFFNNETQVMSTQANIPFGIMAKGIGASLAGLNITSHEFESFMAGIVYEYDTRKREQNEQNKKND